MSRWAACLFANDFTALAGLRLQAEIEMAQVGGAIWLRGNNLAPELEVELKKIPGLERFELLDAERLRPVHSRIAERRLPPATWGPLRQAIAVAMPVAALAGEVKQKVPIVLTRSNAEKVPTALLTTIDEWAAFAEVAAIVRLNSLRFAAMENGQVLVCGSPLPSLPGLRLAENSGIFLPCGYTWSPPLDAEVLRRLFQLAGQDIVVLSQDHTHQVIRAEQFVPATRSAARATAIELNHAQR